MLGPRLNTVFASRWKALWWAGCVVLTAYCTVPREGEDNASAIVPAGLVSQAGDAKGDTAGAVRASDELRAMLRARPEAPAPTAPPPDDDAWGKAAAEARRQHAR